MRIRLYFIILVFVFIFISCNNRVEKRFYNNGDVKELISHTNDTCFNIKKFYPNKILKLKGFICNSMYNGRFEEYYKNGHLKWKGEYINGYRNYDTFQVVKLPCSIYVKNNIKQFNVGGHYPLQILIDKIHPEDIMVGVNNGIIKNYSNKDEYDFILTPSKIGKVKFYIYAKINQKKILICEKEMIVNK